MKKTLGPRNDGRGLPRLPLIPTLLALAAGTAVSQAAELTFQYYRFTPTKNRGGDAENQTQVSEFEFFFRGARLDHSPVVATGGVTHPNPGDPESAQKLVDGTTATKWFDNNKVPVVFNFGSQVSVDSYRFATANDALYRTPVRWTLHGSNDNVNWVLIDDRSGGDNATPTSFFTFRPLLVATPPASTGYPVFSTFQTTSSIVEPATTNTSGQSNNDPVYQVFPSIVKNAGPETSLTWNVTNSPTGVSLTPALPEPPVNFADTRLLTPVSPDVFTDYTLSATTASGTAALTHKVRAVPGGAATARYVRFSANALRGTGNIAQLAEFEFYNGATKLTGLTASNPGGDTNNNANETADKVIDGNHRTKWLNHNNAALVFDLGSARTFDGYQFTTGNDGSDRDPVRWSLETSADGITWSLLDTAYDYNPPSLRRAKTGIIPLSGIATLKWTGSQDPNWDLATENWVTGTSAAAAFSNGVNVILDESSAVREVSLTEALSPNSVSVVHSSGDPYVLSGAPISGSGDLFKRGSGELHLNSANTFSGAILAEGGKIVVNDFEALGDRGVRTRLQLDGTELHVATSLTTERRLRVGPAGATVNVDDGFTLTKVGPSDLLGTLTKTGFGTLQFNGYNGSTCFAAEDLVVNEGVVDFAAATGFFNSRPFTTSGSAMMKITVNSGAMVRFSTDSALGGDYVNFQSSLDQVRVIGGTLDFNHGGFNYIHTGTVGGEGRIVLQGGTLTGGGQIEPAGLTPENPVTVTFTSLASDQSSYISGSGALALNPGNSSLTLVVADGSAEDDLIVQKPVTGSRPLIKNGAGNLVLTGANSLSGPFTVSAGSLTLGNFSGNATGTSALAMAAGTTLRGHGSTAGSLNVAGAISPGDGFLEQGTLTLGSTVLTGSLEIGVFFNETDKLAVNGTLDVTAATLNVTGDLTEPLYQIVSALGPVTGPFATANVPAGYSLVYGPNSVTLLSNTAPAYEIWAAALSDPSPEGDIDGDGIVNVLEFILNSDPLVSSTGDLPDVATNPAGDLVFSFVRKSSSAYLGAAVEYSTDLSEGSWEPFGGTAVQSGTPGAGLDTVTATLPASLAGPGGKIFARLKVDMP